ncbi:MAG: SNF2-related protein [Crocinitomicaceae bacterium]|nr:SNF2-related protein [Crocinitomicaceae bacterium]
MSSTLLDAQVDLNPHQIEAALFAFKSPLSKGAILADEVGLGKTIEAGILLSQKWAERKRRLLIICPSSLRKQWSNELKEKFFLPSIILESKSFNKAIKDGNPNPFSQNENIVICSFHFARNKDVFVRQVMWDLVTIDEAHRLRNVYKKSNKIGKAIREALSGRNKVLLTATPLQNSLLELYGLVSFIDEHTFGDIKSFRQQFIRPEETQFLDLRERISPVCQRTLRRQVQEYIRYTSRIPITIGFVPSDEEHTLYEQVSEYLQRKELYALPTKQKHLMTLILRKLLASSSHAIAGTLTGLVEKLQKVVKNKRKLWTEFQATLEEEVESLTDLEYEWNDEVEEEVEMYTPEEILAVEEEIQELKAFRDLALSIVHDAKGKNLKSALEQGFEKLAELGAPQKALIFTESVRTQNYLFKLLEETGYEGKVVLFNGTNTGEKAKEIYKAWKLRHVGSSKFTGSLNVDRRAAVVDYFREEATIMVATEAAAEGINLQFCSLVINYDLPWNPQRIEQRIGRCHRYGQKFDVVVVNFLNKRNAADRRVFELLDEKFQLFSGVFGASDEVLGTIESGVDFENRIAEIYQTCRTDKEIQMSFDELQKEMEDQINRKLKTTQQKLLEHFDVEVVDKLRTRLADSEKSIQKYEKWLWAISRYHLKSAARFEENNYRFFLNNKTFNGKPFDIGPYGMGRIISDAHVYRVGHPLAQEIIELSKNGETPIMELIFDLTNSPFNIAALEDYKGKRGIVKVIKITVDSFETTDHILFIGNDSNNKPIEGDLLKRLLELPAKAQITSLLPTEESFLEERESFEKKRLLELLRENDNRFFLEETEKLTKWAEDKVFAAENAIKETKAKIKELNRQSKQAQTSQEQLEIQKQLRELTRKQRHQRQTIFDVEDEIAEERDKMIGDIEERMMRKVSDEYIFTIKWKLI